MKHFILFFSLCTVGQFINGHTLMDLLSHAINSDVWGNDHYKINQPVKKSIYHYDKHLPSNLNKIKTDQKENKLILGNGSDELYPNIIEYEDIYSSDNESANSDLYQDDAFGQDVFKNKTSDINKRIQMTLVRFMTEVEAGDAADMLGQNKHVEQSNVYLDLGRRFVPQYKYTDTYKEPAAEHNDELIPEKAPPELVLLIAKESALMGPDKQSDLDDFDEKKILRSGNYWNAFWKEEVKPRLRSTPQKKVLGSVKAKIKPGSEFYKVVSQMKKMSPRLLYIINKKQKH